MPRRSPAHNSNPNPNLDPTQVAARFAHSPLARVRTPALSAAWHVLVRRRLLATLAFVVLLQVTLLGRQLHKASAAAAADTSVPAFVYDASLARWRRSLTRQALYKGSAAMPETDDVPLIGYEAAVTITRARTRTRTRT